MIRNSKIGRRGLAYSPRELCNQQDGWNNSQVAPTDAEERDRSCNGRSSLPGCTGEPSRSSGLPAAGCPAPPGTGPEILHPVLLFAPDLHYTPGTESRDLFVLASLPPVPSRSGQSAGLPGGQTPVTWRSVP